MYLGCTGNAHFNYTATVSANQIMVYHSYYYCYSSSCSGVIYVFIDCDTECPTDYITLSEQNSCDNAYQLVNGQSACSSNARRCSNK